MYITYLKLLLPSKIIRKKTEKKLTILTNNLDKRKMHVKHIYMIVKKNHTTTIGVGCTYI